VPFDGKEYIARIDAVEKIDQVIDLLSLPDRWCKGELYRRGADQRCIVGAIHAVDAVAMLRGPVLQAIHEIAGKNYQHIETFNDARSTTHALVLQVLLRARENLSGERISRPIAVRVGWWSRLRWCLRQAANLPSAR
jgi:hypothetical protein